MRKLRRFWKHYWNKKCTHPNHNISSPLPRLQVRRMKGIGELVKLFNSENQEVQRFATGATRNLIYENMENKVVLIEEGGIPQLVEALKEPDDELRKNITGRKIPILVIKFKNTTQQAELIAGSLFYLQ